MDNRIVWNKQYVRIEYVQCGMRWTTVEYPRGWDSGLLRAVELARTVVSQNEKVTLYVGDIVKAQITGLC